MTKFTITNELLGAAASPSDLAAFKSDPHGFLSSRANTEVSSEVSFTFAENSGDTVHIALPYYPELDQARAAAIDSDELDSVSGGEITSMVAHMVDAATLPASACAVAGAQMASASSAATCCGVMTRDEAYAAANK